jgi:hypothetical protein
MQIVSGLPGGDSLALVDHAGDVEKRDDGGAFAGVDPNDSIPF